MKRTLEPELMDDDANAEAYAAADFAEVNERFVDRFCDQTPTLYQGTVVDLGCGPGDVAIRLARRRPGLKLVGVDGAEAMLRLARASGSTLAGQLTWICARLPADSRAILAARPENPDAPSLGPGFDAVISNSLLHHLPDPQVLWHEVLALGRPGTEVLVVDLKRPASTKEARALVDAYASSDPDILRTDFYNSLLAAFTPDEVRAQLENAGLAGTLGVEIIGDRHLAISGRLAGSRKQAQT